MRHSAQEDSASGTIPSPRWGRSRTEQSAESRDTDTTQTGDWSFLNVDGSSQE
ncbi:hypothetical protein PVAP13_6NG306000 [Panicum virgatum]|uniref:Uncharacterized protein n=1 Tax=Panicum virgatum TaxID=38727 RepID=A0A8T0R375_PANVG|nr:hypothetical protein PVAP13_6NG306000 [Panicum virgatum]